MPPLFTLPVRRNAIDAPANAANTTGASTLAANIENLRLNREGPHQRYGKLDPELIAILDRLKKDESITDKKIKNYLKEALDISSVAAVFELSHKNATRFVDLIEEIANFLGLLSNPEHDADTPMFYAEAVRLQRALLSDEPLCEQFSLMRLLLGQAMVLHTHARNAEACKVTEEAVAICRECYCVNPDDERSQLASMLHAYSTYLYYQQFWAKALVVCEEAVVLRRMLYESDPNKYREDLAHSLYRLGRERYEMRCFEEAKAAAEESLVLWRTLFEDDICHYCSLAYALTHYITTLSDCGAVEEYRRAVAEREALWAKLRENHIGTFSDDIEPCFHRCGQQMQGEPGVALDSRRVAYEGPCAKVLDKLRELDKDEDMTNGNIKKQVKEALELAPQIIITSDSYLPNQLCNRATRFRTLLDQIQNYFCGPERLEDLLLFGAEAIRLQRTLSSCAPIYLHSELARLLRNQASMLYSNWRATEACELAKEAMLIQKECYKAHPGQERPLLASILLVYLVYLFDSDKERYHEACEANEEAVNLYRILYALDPEEYISRLADALQALGGRMSSIQRFTEAVAVEDERLKLRRIMYEMDPEAYCRPLIWALNDYIAALVDVGLPKETHAARAELAKVSVDTQESS
ncbi:hypothetical protein DL93DRAFT_1954192 [Clavulina sp. PMI_390]|nr:hypothetical protein DL93DRAFT_1954192 [Clavulina sp. PMI_390]